MNIKDLNKLPEDTPPLITNASILFTSICSAPMGLNDTNEIKITGMNLRVLLIPRIIFNDLILVLFSLDCHVNQSKSYRLKK